jgi:hypothetical protein
MNWWNQVPNFSNLPKIHNIVIKFSVHNLSKIWNAKNILCANNLKDSGVLMPHFIIFLSGFVAPKDVMITCWMYSPFFSWLLTMIWFYNSFIKFLLLLNKQFKVYTFNVSFHRNYVIHFVEFNATLMDMKSTCPLCHGQNNRSLH